EQYADRVGGAAGEDEVVPGPRLHGEGELAHGTARRLERQRIRGADLAVYVRRGTAKVELIPHFPAVDLQRPAAAAQAGFRRVMPRRRDIVLVHHPADVGLAEMLELVGPRQAEAEE